MENNMQIHDSTLEQMIDIFVEASTSEHTKNGGFNLNQSECDDVATALIELQKYREFIRRHREKRNNAA